MQSVIETLNGAWPAADWTVSGNAMRWTPPPPDLPEQTADPGDLLPLVPDVVPPGAVQLRILVSDASGVPGEAGRTLVNGHDDCNYWGLTLPQCMRYHGRVSSWYAGRARMFADKSDRLGRIAIRLWLVALPLFALSLLLQVIR